MESSENQKIILASENQCTGCGACTSRCPTDAISMDTDELGFFRPHIHTARCICCHNCENLCPVLETPASNSPIATTYAVWAKDEIRASSSSGGAFSVLAEAILAQHGVVYGSGQIGTNVSNIQILRIEDVGHLNLLRGSKYVQSFSADAYVQVEEDIKSGRNVLFSGTPCQIAALNKVLSKPYDNLLTIGVVCHGVPSQKMLSDYLIEAKLSPEKLLFRDKDNGWTATIFTLVNTDGSKKNLLYSNCAFEEGFHSYTILQASCYDCPFCGLSRQEDITLGDYWGINNYKTDWNDGKGTSLVLINSSKGNRWIESVKSEFTRFEEVPLNYALENRLHQKNDIPLGRRKFPTLRQSHNFTQSVESAIQATYDVGLVGDWAVENFGANITYYALYCVLSKRLNLEVLMIERAQTAPWPPKSPPTTFGSIPYPSFSMAHYAKDTAALFAFNDQCDKFLLGSDQIWNNDLYRAFGTFSDLSWVNNDKLKVAYATSFGSDFVWGPDSDHKTLAEWLRKFDAISVREKSGVEILKNRYGVDGVWVLDPVFLCNKEEYTALAQSSGYTKKTRELVLFSYMLDFNQMKSVLLQTAAAALGAELVVITDAAKDRLTESNTWNIPLKTDLFLEEWLAQIIHCDYMITDSFHGMCFAILFHKPFIAIANDDRGVSRFHSLLGALHLENHLAMNAEDALEKLNFFNSAQFDWDAIDAILDRETLRSLRWLEDSLAIPTAGKVKTSYDFLAPHVIAHNEHIHYIDNYSYIDVLPSQSVSGKRTRLALGDQKLEYQVWSATDTIEFCSRVALMQDIDLLNSKMNEIIQNQKLILDRINFEEHEWIQKYNDGALIIQRMTKRLDSFTSVAAANTALKNSFSYKIGRVITWLPRKIRDGFRSLLRKRRS